MPNRAYQRFQMASQLGRNIGEIILGERIRRADRAIQDDVQEFTRLATEGKPATEVADAAQNALLDLFETAGIDREALPALPEDQRRPLTQTELARHMADMLNQKEGLQRQVLANRLSGIAEMMIGAQMGDIEMRQQEASARTAEVQADLAERFGVEREIAEIHELRERVNYNRQEDLINLEWEWREKIERLKLEQARDSWALRWRMGLDNVANQLTMQMYHDLISSDDLFRDIMSAFRDTEYDLRQFFQPETGADWSGLSQAYVDAVSRRDGITDEDELLHIQNEFDTQLANVLHERIRQQRQAVWMKGVEAYYDHVKDWFQATPPPTLDEFMNNWMMQRGATQQEIDDFLGLFTPKEQAGEFEEIPSEPGVREPAGFRRPGGDEYLRIDGKAVHPTEVTREQFEKLNARGQQRVIDWLNYIQYRRERGQAIDEREELRQERERRRHQERLNEFERLRGR